MTLSIWRKAHLWLAIITSLFLFAASTTGVILAVDAVNEKTLPYKTDNFGEITLANSIPALKEKYPELLELSVDHNQFVIAQGFDEEGNDFKAYIHPLTGEILGQPEPKSEFYQWNLALHRSLFIHETGRFIVGIISFLLMLIVVSGTILIIRRQQGIRHFFDRMSRDFFSQYFHVVSGRLLLIPVFLIAATGTYLFLVRFDIIRQESPEPIRYTVSTDTADEAADAANEELTNNQGGSAKIPLAEFPIFRELKLAGVSKIEFPIDEDPEEYYRIKTKDRELLVSQVDGAIVEETRYPLVTIWENLSLDLHTGRTNAVWAIILGIASLNILFFIYTGFAITVRRISVKTRNKFKAEEAEIILLVGSENGSTLGFAHQVHTQLLSQGKKSFITELNKYQSYPNARQMVVFSSTFGLGDAPSNANRFLHKLAAIPQPNKIEFSVVGFGSRTYEDFCGYAILLDKQMEQQSWAIRALELHTVNDKSKEDFIHWIRDWNGHTGLNLATSPALYGSKPPALKKMKLVKKTSVTAEDPNFRLWLKPVGNLKFRSGDLLAIYPANDDRERLYSIARQQDSIMLVVKLHEYGLGSQYLHNLQEGSEIQARIIQNPSFHFPSRASQVAMISNGTGIAPFLGMIEENRRKTDLRLYAGFRRENDTIRAYRRFAAEQIQKNQLQQLHISLSQGPDPQYVMDLIRRDADYFAALLRNDGVIMICGALAMQRDVEAILEAICLEKNGLPLSYFKTRGQVLTDCY